MIKNLPTESRFPVTQGFGEHPEIYADVLCGERGQLGHNGIDFATPLGTPVIAVQHGSVLRTDFDSMGFGRYVVIGHAWGQTLYAHLSEVTVAQGQNITAGTRIGRSGSSGNSTGPHLHFGMRLQPYDMEDGWCGYSDPAPYLARLTQPLGPMMGPHIVGGVHQYLDLLRTWQPRTLLVLDPNPDEMADLRNACPDTVIVGRVFATDQDVDNRIRTDPEEAARWAHTLCMERMTSEVDYWQVANEVLQKEDGLPLLNRFELERMRLAEEAGYYCAICAFSVGNPDLPEDERMALWKLVYPAIERAEINGHCVALHQYGTPDIWGPEDMADWLIYRLEHQVLRRLPYKRVKFVVTEYGIDGLIQGTSAAGWQTVTSAEDYSEQLIRSGRYVERFMGRILGYCVFTLGHNPPWGTYDINGDVANMLANNSPRGTWDEVGTVAIGYGPADSDKATDPGGGGDRVVDGGDDGDGSHGGDGTLGGNVGGGNVPGFEQRISTWVEHYNMQLKGLDDRPDNPDPDGEIVYLIKDVFTTMNGSWEPSSEPGSIPQWARDDYLTAEFLEAGADHHLFAAVIGLDGELSPDFPIQYWSDGFDRLGDPNYDSYIREQTKQSSGWANMFMAGGSSFVPERGESGPWCWTVNGAADVMCGGGLPANHHLSTFVVWQAVNRDDLDPTDPTDPTYPTEPTEPTEPTDPTDPTEPTDPTDPGEPVEPPFERRISDWAIEFNLTIKSLGESPIPEDADIVYMIKDIFTTINGSWEPTDAYGSIPQWARDDYLKPFGAPDYFDDAGGDHHLFAAVIGEDGELLRLKDIVYWSDGFDVVNDPTYNEYIYRQTKHHSGWINIPIGPGSSYVPERGEIGPWCWVPTGGAEAICGGGLPAKHHISTFVVWQVVQRDEINWPGDGGGEKPESGDGTNIYMPVVFGESAPTADDPSAASAPAPQPEPVDEIGRIRQAAWNRLGFDDAESTIAAYARANELGAPQTQAFEIDGFQAQGFQKGIVYLDPERPENVWHMPW